MFGADEGSSAIREFAEQCMDDATAAPSVTAPSHLVFEASMPNGNEVVEQMTAAGWKPAGEVQFVAQLETWADARELLAAAMNAALAPFLPYWLGGFDRYRRRRRRSATRGATAADLRRLGAGVTAAVVHAA